MSQLSHDVSLGRWGQDVTTDTAATHLHLLDQVIITMKKLRLIKLHVSLSADKRVGIYLVSRIMHFAWQSSM